LTEFNTAHNKRLSQFVDLNATNTSSSGLAPMQIRRKKKSVVFIEDVEIINPEDIDPNIGRFRNMVSTTIVIPNKQKRPQNQLGLQIDHQKRFKMSDKLHDNDYESLSSSKTLYDDDDDAFNDNFSSSIASNLGIRKLDLAPDIDEQEQHYANEAHDYSAGLNPMYEGLDKRKRYVKEAWPGREPANATSTSQRLSQSPQKEQRKDSLSPIHHRLVALAPLILPEKPSNQEKQQQQQSNQPPKRLVI
jgi:nuclear inhibitor of protein phosphatase 1